MGYPKEVYDVVKNYYEIHQFDAKNERDYRRKKIYAEIPQIEKIDKEIQKTGLSLLSIDLTDESGRKELEKKRDLVKKLTDERTEVLVSSGYEKNYLDILYTCPVCKDTGVLETGYCECFKKALQKEAYNSANLPIMMDSQSFDTFRLNAYPEEEQEGMETVLNVCKEFAKDFKAQSGENLYLYGAPGLGKTFLSSCIAKEVIGKGYGVFYQPAYKIFRIFEDYKFSQENKSINKYHIDKIMNSDLLIIDDLGAEMATAYTAEVLFDLINTRINEKLPTIINTNLDFPDLETIYSARITSRILGNFTLLEFNGEDLRGM